MAFGKRKQRRAEIAAHYDEQARGQMAALGLDIDQVMAAATSGTAMLGSAGEQAAYAEKAQRLNAVGVDTPGRVEALQPLGTPFGPYGIEHRVDVTVMPPGAQPYAASFTQSIMGDSLGLMQPGATITLRVDPHDPSSMLFWGAG